MPSKKSKTKVPRVFVSADPNQSPGLPLGRYRNIPDPFVEKQEASFSSLLPRCVKVYRAKNNPSI